MIDAVDNALDAFIRRHFHWTHQSISPCEDRAKAAAAYRQIASETDLAMILAPTVEITDSALAGLAGEMFATTTATAALFPSPLASAAHEPTSAPDPGVPEGSAEGRQTPLEPRRRKAEAAVKAGKSRAEATRTKSCMVTELREANIDSLLCGFRCGSSVRCRGGGFLASGWRVGARFLVSGWNLLVSGY